MGKGEVKVTPSRGIARAALWAARAEYNWSMDGEPGRGLLAAMMAQFWLRVTELDAYDFMALAVEDHKVVELKEVE